MNSTSKILIGLLILIVGGVIGYFIGHGAGTNQAASLYTVPTTQTAMVVNGGQQVPDKAKTGDACTIYYGDGTSAPGNISAKGNCVRKPAIAATPGTAPQVTLAATNGTGTPMPDIPAAGTKCQFSTGKKNTITNGTTDAYGNCIAPIVVGGTTFNPNVIK